MPNGTFRSRGPCRGYGFFRRHGTRRSGYRARLMRPPHASRDQQRLTRNHPRRGGARSARNCVRSGLAWFVTAIALQTSPTHGSASVTGEPPAAPCGRGFLRRESRPPGLAQLVRNPRSPARDRPSPWLKGLRNKSGWGPALRSSRCVSPLRSDWPRDSCARFADPRCGHSSRHRRHRAAPAAHRLHSRC